MLASSDQLKMNLENKDNNSGSILFSENPNDIELAGLSINSLNEPFFIMDTDFNFKLVNNAFTKAYGYSTGEVTWKTIDIIFAEKQNSESLDEIKNKAKKNSFKGTQYHKRKNGRNFLVLSHIANIRNELNETIAFVSTSVDLSDHSLVEDILEIDENKYKSLFTELKETVYESTPDGRILDINPSGVELFGYDSKEELLAIKSAAELYRNPEDREELAEILEKDGFVKNYEIEVINKHGEILNLLETAIGVEDSNGKITSYRGILHDITETKKNQELLTKYLEQLAGVNDQLKISEAELRRVNNEKDKFFSILSHDLKTPVSAIMSYSEILKDEFETLSGDEIKQFIGSLNEVSSNLFELLEGLLNWSRVQTGRMPYFPEILDIRYIIDSLHKFYLPSAQKKKISLTTSAIGSCRVFADENMVRTVLRNLISNAIKFTRESGKILIKADESENFVNVSIKDNGIGIKQKNIDKLFRIDVHHTTAGTANETGTGLGLILCKELIERNNGTITVKSKQGLGTTFRITLPRK